MLPLYTSILLSLTTLITASPHPLTPRCTPSTNFTLQAVSSNSTYNDVYVSDAFELDITRQSPPTTFFKNDTNHLYAYVSLPQNLINDSNLCNGSCVYGIELAPVCALAVGWVSAGWSSCATISGPYGDENPVFLGNYTASDVAFPNPMGKLGFNISDDQNDAGGYWRLGGWWVCPEPTGGDGKEIAYALANGASQFPAEIETGDGYVQCTEIEMQIKPIENVDC